MRVQMNIEVAPGRERDLRVTARAFFGKAPQVQPFVALYEGPSGPEIQTVQVLSFDYPRSLSHAVGAAYLLSLEFEQDCVAVHFPETGHGMLVGPNAAKWGDFDPKYFHHPLPVASVTSTLLGE